VLGGGLLQYSTTVAAEAVRMRQATTMTDGVEGRCSGGRYVGGGHPGDGGDRGWCGRASR
jgi:hypothetical protein